MRGNEVDLALGTAIAKELVKRGIKRERLAATGVCIDAFAINRCADAIEEAVRKIPELRTYPQDGEVFELSITEPFTGLQMITDEGFTGTWRFTGQEIAEPQTRKFKLVSIGYQPSFEAVKEELARHGKIPQGQWRKAFKKGLPEDRRKLGRSRRCLVGRSGRPRLLPVRGKRRRRVLPPGWPRLELPLAVARRGQVTKLGA